MDDDTYIHRIYEAVLDADSFAELPNDLAAITGARSCWMLWQDPQARFSVDAHSGHWDAGALRFYAEHGAESDPLIAASHRPGVINHFGRATDVVGMDRFLGSAFYNEHVRKEGSDTYWVAGASFDTVWGTGTIGLHRSRGMGDFDAAVMARLSRLAPHLRRCLVLRSEIGALRGLALTAPPERAMLHLDAEARVISLDAGGEWLLRSHPMFHYRDGRCALHGDAGRRFQGALRRATRSRAPIADIVFVDAAHGAVSPPPVQLSIFPSSVRRGHAVVIARPRVAEPGLPALAEVPPQLSPREMQVFQLLARGQRRDRIAHLLGVSLPTVDLHMTNLRRKLGAQTIPEAIARGYELGLR